MSNTDRTTVTRRSALTTGTLTALGVGLMSAAGARPEPVVAASSATLATVVNAGDLAEECRERFAEYRRSQEASGKAWDRLDATLTPEQAELARKASDAQSGYHLDESYWQAVELARHLPGVAPSILMIWEHITTVSYGRPGACCTTDEGYEP